MATAAAVAESEVAFDSGRDVLVFTHDCDYGTGALPEYRYERVTAYLPIGSTRNGWHLTQIEPLTVSPSLLCMVCRLHGFWQEGRWVDL